MTNSVLGDIRLVQNFRGCRGLIVAGPTTATATLVSTLGRLGVATEILAAPAATALAIDLDPDRDIVFLDGDIDEPPGPASAGCPSPAPVIGLLGVAAPTRLKALLRRGATAILHKPVQGSAVFGALFVGVNGFRRHRHCEVLLERQERRLRARRAVIKAVVRLMHEHDIDEDEAYRRLRRESMTSRVPLEDICDRMAAQALPREAPQDPSRDLQNDDDQREERG